MNVVSRIEREHDGDPVCDGIEIEREYDGYPVCDGIEIERDHDPVCENIDSASPGNSGAALHAPISPPCDERSSSFEGFSSTARTSHKDVPSRVPESSQVEKSKSLVSA